MILSKRLKEITNYIIPEVITADIGTDHAYIPLFLLKNNIVPYVIASDINEGPLAKARETVEKNNLENIELRLGAGLEPYQTGEIAQAIIAGMGGDLIVRILETDKSKSQAIRHFILQPMGQIEVLREYLIKNGYTIKEESVVKEEGPNVHYYTVLSVEPGYEEEKDDLVYRYGEPEKIKKNNDLLEYYDYQMKQLENQIIKMQHSDNQRTIQRRQELERRLEYIREIKNESLKNS